MADGFIVGNSIDTLSSPESYWDGTRFVPEIDSALLFETVEGARAESGRLQVVNTGSHVESYSATLTVAHNPPLAASGGV